MVFYALLSRKQEAGQSGKQKLVLRDVRMIKKISSDKLIDSDEPEIASHWYFCDEIDWQDERVMCLGIAEHLDWTISLALYPTENCSLVNPRAKRFEFRRIGLAIWDTKVWQHFLGPEDDGYSHIRERVKRFCPPATIVNII